jgi:P-type Cu+ transporter
MHPKVRVDQPGNCPQCGTTLEPVSPAVADGADAGDDQPLQDFQRRFYWSLPLTVVVFVLALVGNQLALFDRGTQNGIELAFTLPVVLWAVWPFCVRGAQSIAHRSPNMWTLIGLGTGSAFVYRVVATVAPQVFPASLVSMRRVAVSFEAAAVIISLTLLAQMLEGMARSQTSAAIRSLLRLAPKTARRLAEGDALIGAALDTSGALVMRADMVGTRTVLASIVQLVEQAQRAR